MEIIVSIDDDGQLVTEIGSGGPEPEPLRPGWPRALPKPDLSIEAWWTADHDFLIRSLMVERRWWWAWKAPDAIVDMTDPELMAAWQSGKGMSKGWYDRLMYFAEDRALKLGYYDELLGDAPTVTCGRCGSTFLEPDGRGPDLGYRVDICNACITSCIWQPKKNNRAGKHAICQWLVALSELIGRVPPSGYATNASDLAPLTTEVRVRLLDLVVNRPSDVIIKRRFGSWLNALIAAGVLPDGTRRTSRGTQSIASDGHICYSIGERTIDDFLTASGVAHEREPLYPSGRYRGDFLIPGAMIEYFGLAGNAAYDSKSAEKVRLCAEAGIRLVALYAPDLVSPDRLRSKILGQGAVAITVQQP